MNLKRIYIPILLGCIGLGMHFGVLAKSGFDIVALGVSGGMQDGNLSAFLIKHHSDPNWISCDAGSLTNGIIQAIKKDSFYEYKELTSEGQNPVGVILQDKIKGYLISHAHLDHLAGLIIASPDDKAKPIYALKSVSDEVNSLYFNWRAWPNFSSSGDRPLKKYSSVILESYKPVKMENTGLTVTAFPLSHGDMLSTAFLLESGNESLLCVGDTGPDSIEQGNSLHTLWKAVAQRVQTGSLKGIIIESSFTNSRPDQLLFGHLTPKYILQELSTLAKLAGQKSALKDLPVIISHIKYNVVDNVNTAEVIQAQLNSQNTLGVRFILPQQGERYALP